MLQFAIEITALLLIFGLLSGDFQAETVSIHGRQAGTSHFIKPPFATSDSTKIEPCLALFLCLGSRLTQLHVALRQLVVENRQPWTTAAITPLLLGPVSLCEADASNLVEYICKRILLQAAGSRAGRSRHPVPSATLAPGKTRSWCRDP